LVKVKVNTLGCHPNWPQGAPVAAPLENPGLFYCALRSLAMFQVSQRQAGKLAALRFLHSVLEPLVSRPLRSASFLNRPHDLKFKTQGFIFRKVDWRDQNSAERSGFETCGSKTERRQCEAPGFAPLTIAPEHVRHTRDSAQ